MENQADKVNAANNAAAFDNISLLKNDPSRARCMFLGTVTGGLPIGAFSSRCSSCRQLSWDAAGCDMWKFLQKNLDLGNRIGHQFKRLNNYKRVRSMSGEFDGARSRKHTRHSPRLVSWMLKRSPEITRVCPQLKHVEPFNMGGVWTYACFILFHDVMYVLDFMFVPSVFHQHVYFKMLGVLCL